MLYTRVGDKGWCVGRAGALSAFGYWSDGTPSEPWDWVAEPQQVSILALGLTGEESKETLSALVEHFEETEA
jgi:hypothetical protein